MGGPLKVVRTYPHRRQPGDQAPNPADLFDQHRDRVLAGHTRVNNLHLRLLGRPAELTGADYWAGRVLRDGDIALAANLAASDEYYQRAQIR